LPSRRTILAGAVAAVAIGAVVIADWLIVTEEERLDAFVDTVTGRIDDAKIEGALSWTDPKRQPLELTFRGQSYRFDADNCADLRSKAYTHLASYQGEKLTLLSKSVEVSGRKATIVVDTLSRRGRTTVEYELRKTGKQWLVSGVFVR
jgi:hypothetical protein